MYNRHELLDKELTLTITAIDIRWQWQVWRKEPRRRSTTLYITGFDSPGDGLMVERAASQGPHDECEPGYVKVADGPPDRRGHECVWLVPGPPQPASFFSGPALQLPCVVSFCRWAAPSLFFVCQLVLVGCNYSSMKWMCRQMMICHVYIFWWF
jgi:hypothetical protein